MEVNKTCPPKNDNSQAVGMKVGGSVPDVRYVGAVLISSMSMLNTTNVGKEKCKSYELTRCRRVGVLSCQICWCCFDFDS